MRIEKIRLENIRSYVQGEIIFPEGSVLLSGNIGCGKSTILLAMEFALFGLKRGSGTALLRNGSDKGNVELDFSLENKKVKIFRSLKRTSNGVTQDAGYTVINGERKEGTALELKQRIIEILNYPKELLTKDNIIYRYTVYTPQEHMKEILLGDKDSRLDTLRKVFGIDKYKRIRENTKAVLIKVKERRKELAGMISDLHSKKEEAVLKEEKIAITRKELERLMPEIETLMKRIEDKNKDTKVVEESIDALRKYKQELQMKELNLNHKLQEKKQVMLNIEKLEEEMLKLKEENLDFNVEEIAIKLKAEEKALSEEKNKLSEITAKVHETRTKKVASETLKNKIIELNNCPTCYQEVSEGYKFKIKDREDSNINNFNLKLDNLTNAERVLQEKIINIQSRIEVLQQEIQKVELIKLKKANLEEKSKQKEELTQKQETIKSEIGAINLSRSELFTKIQPLENIEETYSILRQAIDKLNEEHKVLEIKKATLETEIRNISDNINSLKEEIMRREESGKELAKLNSLQSWLNEQFIKLMATMEKNIMLKVHTDFNSLFEKWFSTLIDSELLNMKLDEEFGPSIEQNGYDIDYTHLSGGEKTAAALAYRLALNQVINQMMVSIKTNDLLILDEPTDGFSAEQLDKMNDVLEDLDISQVIIVSHEPKIESFVDSVLKFSKTEHSSKIVNT